MSEQEKAAMGKAAEEFDKRNYGYAEDFSDTFSFKVGWQKCAEYRDAQIQEREEKMRALVSAAKEVIYSMDVEKHKKLRDMLPEFEAALEPRKAGDDE